MFLLWRLCNSLSPLTFPVPGSEFFSLFSCVLSSFLLPRSFHGFSTGELQACSLIVPLFYKMLYRVGEKRLPLAFLLPWVRNELADWLMFLPVLLQEGSSSGKLVMSLQPSDKTLKLEEALFVLTALPATERERERESWEVRRRSWRLLVIKSQILSFPLLHWWS